MQKSEEEKQYMQKAKTIGPDDDRYKTYREFCVSDEDIDLLLQLAFISPMTLEGSKLHKPLADMLEVIHPHHAGAFMVRGMRAEAEGDHTSAADMYLLAVEADLRAEEAAIVCLNMLNTISLSTSDVADELRDFLKKSNQGREYLKEYDCPTSSRSDKGNDES